MFLAASSFVQLAAFFLAVLFGSLAAVLFNCLVVVCTAKSRKSIDPPSWHLETGPESARNWIA